MRDKWPCFESKRSVSLACFITSLEVASRLFHVPTKALWPRVAIPKGLHHVLDELILGVGIVSWPHGSENSHCQDTPRFHPITSMTWQYKLSHSNTHAGFSQSWTPSGLGTRSNCVQKAWHDASPSSRHSNGRYETEASDIYKHGIYP